MKTVGNLFNNRLVSDDKNIFKIKIATRILSGFLLGGIKNNIKPPYFSGCCV